MQKGNIGVTTENIFPIIKKFLYSDHEIFLREIVSNAVDATQKLKTLSSMGEYKGELGDLTVRVSLNNDTITISDRGIGLTAEEIEKYINQIAFSGASDFLEKYKNDANAIIGHFGLGFYSSFMVSKKVEIVTKSYKEGAQAIKWSCDGSPEYTLTNADKEDRGTDIVLYIDDDCKEFLDTTRISSLLNKYCSFLPVPVSFGKKKEWKEGRNACIGSLLKVKRFTPYVPSANGKSMADHKARPAPLRNPIEYEYIRNHIIGYVYEIFYRLSQELGDHFYMFLTDCVFTDYESKDKAEKYFSSFGYKTKSKPVEFTALDKTQKMIFWHDFEDAKKSASEDKMKGDKYMYYATRMLIDGTKTSDIKLK